MKKLLISSFLLIVLSFQTFATQIALIINKQEKLSSNKSFVKAIESSASFILNAESLIKTNSIDSEKLQELISKLNENKNATKEEVAEKLKNYLGEDIVESLLKTMEEAVQNFQVLSEEIDLNKIPKETLEEETIIVINSMDLKSRGPGPALKKCIANAVLIAEIAYFGCYGLGFAAFPCFAIAGLMEIGLLRRCNDLYGK